MSKERNNQSSFSGKFSNNVTVINDAASSISSVIKDSASIIGGTASLITEASLVGINLKNSFTNTSQYEDLINAAGSAATSFYNSKINRIKDLWNTKVDVSIQSIIGEVAPYALKLEGIGSTLENRLSKVLSFLLGTGSNESGTFNEVLEDLGSDALDALKSDASLGQSISNLSAVQAYASTFNVIAQAYNIITKAKNIYETLSKGLEITSDLALAFWSGGTSAAKAANTMAEEAQREISLIKTLALYAVKKLVFPIKIKLPALIVGAVDSISVRDAMLGLDGEYSWLSTLFDDEFFNDLEYTLTVSDSISEALSSIRGAKFSVESNWEMWKNLEGVSKDKSLASVTRGDLMKSLFQKEFTKSYMTSISALARKNAYLPDYSSVSYYSKNSGSSLQKGSDSSSTSLYSTLWKKQLDDDSEENPIRNIESLMKISKTIYDNL